jgi:hypothetical protein
MHVARVLKVPALDEIAVAKPRRDPDDAVAEWVS